MAAHSTTRALYAAYSGPLYQVRRASDNATTNISPLSAGRRRQRRHAEFVLLRHHAASSRRSTTSPATATTSPTRPAAAPPAAPTASRTPPPPRSRSAATRRYGVFIAAGDGYRDDSTRNIVTGNNSEGEYAIFDGTHFNGGCCFDYGNAETNNDDDGAGTMEAIYFGNIKVWGFGTGNGPWIMADMENGLFSGTAVHLNSGDPTTNFRFTTAMIEGGQNQWAILGGNAQSGSLATDFSGVRPSGYNPMKKQGAIILGIGGDNSKGAAGPSTRAS